MQSVLDGSILQSNFTSNQTLRNLQQADFDDEEAQYLSFKPVKLNFTKNILQLGLKFGKFENVSCTNFGKDSLIIEIKTFKYFVTESGQRFNRFSLVNNSTMQVLPLPTMTANRASGEALQ